MRSIQGSSCPNSARYQFRVLSHGYTLIELMACVAVVFVLLSLMTPALNKAKARAASARCASNLREWGHATFLYCAEHNDRLPKDGAPNGSSTNEGWYVDLPRLMGLPPYHSQAWRTNPTVVPPPSPWICPSNSRRSNGNNLFHYSLNEHVNGIGSGRQTDITSIRIPTQTVWLFDNGKLAAVAQQNNVHTNLHQGGAHFLFLDGHVERFPNHQYWDFSRNRGISENPEIRWMP